VKLKKACFVKKIINVGNNRSTNIYLFAITVAKKYSHNKHFMATAEDDFVKNITLYSEAKAESSTTRLLVEAKG